MVLKIFRYLPLVVVVSLIFVIIGGQISFINVLAGALIGTVISLIFSPLLINDVKKFYQVKRIVYATKYIFYYLFIIEPLAHMKVLKSITSNKPKINPAIVSVRYHVENPFSIVASANSITNTPGTVVIDVDEEAKVFYVHWLFYDILKKDELYNVILKPYEEMLIKVFE